MNALIIIIGALLICCIIAATDTMWDRLERRRDNRILRRRIAQYDLEQSPRKPW